MSPASKREIAQFHQIATVAARLAVFLQAGVGMAKAVEEAASDMSVPEDRDRAETMSTLLRAGQPLRSVIAEHTREASEPWRILGAVVDVAQQSGSPMGDALWSFSTALREHASTLSQVESIIQAPLHTTRLLIALPVLGVGVAWLMGVNAVAVLTGSTLGWVSLAVATVLVLLARAWTKRLIDSVRPGPDALSPALDLLAIATAGGALPERARDRVRVALEEYELPGSATEALDELTALSRRLGVPLRTLAVSEAKWRRHRVLADSLTAQASLQVAILLPLGLLILPAFVLVGVVPVVVALLQGSLTEMGGGLW